MEPHWIKSCGAGVTHHLPGLQLDEGWLCFNMVHSGFGLSRGGFGLAEVRRVHNSVRCQSFVARRFINYSYVDLSRRCRLPFVPGVVVYIVGAHFLIVSLVILPSGVPLPYGCFLFCQQQSKLCVFVFH